MDAGRGELGPEDVDNSGDEALPVRTAAVQQLGDTPVLLRLQETEAHILKLPFDLPDAQAVGQGRVDLPRLAGEGSAHILRQVLACAHQVQSFGQHH